MKVVINADSGGFGLSREALHWLRDRGHAGAIAETDTGEKWPDSDEVRASYSSDSFLYGIQRDDPELIACIEALGSKVSGEHARLRIVEIPDGTDWVIEEYDGNEWIAEAHQTWS